MSITDFEILPTNCDWMGIQGPSIAMAPSV